MNPLWLLAIIPPAYAFMGGLVRTIVHNSFHGSKEKKAKCQSWDDFPCVMWAGWAWPVMFPFLVFTFFAMAGVKAEGLCRIRGKRREIRDKKIRDLEKENGIGQG